MHYCDSKSTNRLQPPQRVFHRTLTSSLIRDQRHTSTPIFGATKYIFVSTLFLIVYFDVIIRLLLGSDFSSIFT